MPKYYNIHDNGTVPFRVKVEKNKITIFSAEYDKKTKQTTYDEIAYEILNYKKIYIGTDPNIPDSKGNSILVHLNKNNYVYIGWFVYSFKTPANDVIIHYVSKIGNSDVPYPYAIGTINTYLMIESVRIKNDKLLSMDPYDQYYNHSKNMVNANNFVEFKKKIIINFK